MGFVYDDGAAYTYVSVGSFILNINGSTTDATHTITLTADPGNRHNGAAGSGVQFGNNVSTTWAVAIQDEYATVEWITITGGAALGAIGFNVVAGAPDNHIVIQNKAPDIWLWELVMGRESKTFAFAVNDLAVGDASMRVWLQGASDLPDVSDHHVSVFVNLKQAR